MIRMFQEEVIAGAKTLGWEGGSLHEDRSSSRVLFSASSSPKSDKKKFRTIVQAIQVGNWVIFVKSSFFAKTIFEFFLGIQKQTSKQTMWNSLWQMVILALGEFLSLYSGTENSCFV